MIVIIAVICSQMWSFKAVSCSGINGCVLNMPGADSVTFLKKCYFFYLPQGDIAVVTT